jgi:tRNA/rRNA methyltransferase
MARLHHSLKSSRRLAQGRIVLVRPAITENIGATARVMHNFGLSDLRLVRPHASPCTEAACKLATRGEPILHAAFSHDELAAAVADCVAVVATSARVGGRFRRQNVMPPRRLMARLVPFVDRGPVAFVFGPEQTGLTDGEITRCHYLLHVPTARQYPVLNLAQAAAITLYEFHAACVLEASSEAADIPPPAAFAHQERMFHELEQALRDLHFLWGTSADTLMHALRHLLGRAGPSAVESDILLGLARQLRWHLNRGYAQYLQTAERPPRKNSGSGGSQGG